MLKLILPLIIIIRYRIVYLSWWQVHLCLIALLILIVPHTTFFTAVNISPYFIQDSLSTSLILLSLLITSIILIARNKILHLATHSYLFVLACEILLLILILAFSASSLILFYIWFEASLIPTLYIILYWGYQPERLQAGMYLMLYTITASLPIFVIFIAVWNSCGSRNIIINTLYLSTYFFDPVIPTTPFISIFLISGMLVKLPIFSTHLWLPKAHVEAPIAGSMVLAAILLKLGGYGLIRIILNFPLTHFPIDILISISLWGATLTGIICLRQSDIKSIIAYSSVGHMGLLIAGVLTLTSWGLVGAIMIIIAHGLCSSALFIIANISYNITHTRSSFLTKGIIIISPSLSMWWFILLAINIAAPPSLNLLREIFLLTRIVSYSLWTILPLAGIRFITAAYSLNLFGQTQHGCLSNTRNPIINYKPIEISLLLIHVIPVLILTLKPELFLMW